MTRNGRIEKGMKIGGAISARAWNRAQEAADIVLGEQGGRDASGVQGPSPLNHQIYVRNDAGSAVGYWGVLAITGVVAPPTGSTGSSVAQFQTEPAVVGVLPTTGATGAYVVALEPIAAGKFGRAAIAGVVQGKLNVIDAAHGFAVPVPGSATAFESATAGPATILWKEPGTGSGKWCLVRIGSGGAGSSIKLGKTSADWAKGSSATIAIYAGSAGAEAATGESVTAYNYFGKVLSGKWVIIGVTPTGANYLIAPEADQTEVVYTAEIVATTSGGVTTSKLVFRRKKVWVHSIEEGTPIELGLAECVPTYTGG